MGNINAQNRKINKYFCYKFSNIINTNNWEKLFLNFNNEKTKKLINNIRNKRTTDNYGNLVEQADLLFVGSLYPYIFKIDKIDFYIKNHKDFFILHSLLKEFNWFIKKEFFKYTLEVESNMLELIIAIFEKMEFDLEKFVFAANEKRTKAELIKIQNDYKKYRISYSLLHQKPMEEYLRYVNVFIKNKEKFLENKNVYKIILAIKNEKKLIEDAITFRNITNHSNYLYNFLNPIYLRNFSFNQKDLKDFTKKRKVFISILRQTKNSWNWDSKIEEFKNNKNHFKYLKMKGYNEHLLNRNLNSIFEEIKFLLYDFNWDDWERKEIEVSQQLFKDNNS